MAAEDYNVADRAPEGGFPVTAGSKVQETVAETPEADAETFRTTDAAGAARANPTRTAAFVGYADALRTHASRADIEGMESRVRRDTGIAGADFAAQDHMRLEPSNTPPTPGSVDGVAPDADAAAGFVTNDNEPAANSDEPTLAARSVEGEGDEGRVQEQANAGAEANSDSDENKKSENKKSEGKKSQKNDDK